MSGALPMVFSFRPSNQELEEVYFEEVYRTFRPFHRLLALSWGALVFFGGIFIIIWEKKFGIGDAVRLLAGALIMWFLHLQAWLGLRRIRRTAVPDTNYTLTVSGTGISVRSSADETIAYPWTDLAAVGFARGNVLVFTASGQRHIIPRRAFRDEQQARLVVGLVSESIESAHPPIEDV